MLHSRVHGILFLLLTLCFSGNFALSYATTEGFSDTTTIREDQSKDATENRLGKDLKDTQHISNILKIPLVLEEKIDVDGFTGLLFTTPFASRILCFLINDHIFLGDIYRMDGTNITKKYAHEKNSLTILDIFTNALEKRQNSQILNGTDHSIQTISSIKEKLFAELITNEYGTLLSEKSTKDQTILMFTSPSCHFCTEAITKIQKATLPVQIKRIPVCLNEQDIQAFKEMLAKEPQKTRMKKLQQIKDATRCFGILSNKKAVPCYVFKDSKGVISDRYDLAPFSASAGLPETVPSP